MQFNCVKKRHEKLIWMFSRTVQVSNQVCRLFCTSKFCWVSLDDAIVVSTGKLMKLWDSPRELRSSLCERWLTGKDSSEACATACQNCAVFRQVWRHTVKPLSLTECVGRLSLCEEKRSDCRWWYACTKMEGTEDNNKGFEWQGLP